MYLRPSFQVRAPFCFYTEWFMKCLTKEQKRSSNNPREWDTTTTSPFLSIRPSQSASHVTLNEERRPPEPAIIHSRVMNVPAFRRTHHSIHSDNITVAAPAPTSRVQHNPSPVLFLCNSITTTTTRSSIGYSVAAPVTYTLETVTYVRSHTAPRVRFLAPWSLKNQRGERTKVKEDNLGRSKREPKAPHLVCKDENLHTYHVDPCAACYRRLCARDAIVGVQSLRLFDARRGRLGV